MTENVIVLNEKEYYEPIGMKFSWMEEFLDIKKYRPQGPKFDDGTINWQCPCMAGGSLVAHKCGVYFRKLYICMKKNENEDAATKCPNEFVNWAACMQNMTDERRELMRKAMVSESPKN